MREIITVQIGSAGNNIGDAFWQVISGEHGVDYRTGRFTGGQSLQLERINVYFNETAKGRFYARAICVDTAKDTVNKLRAKSAIYSPDNTHSGTDGTGNNFARGFLTEGAEIIVDVLDNIRHQAELADSMEGFQLIHAIGGGTGSGFTSLLMAKLNEEYPDNLISNYVIIPSPNLSQTVVEPYNALLSVPSLINHSLLTFCLDNEALFQLCYKRANMHFNSYEHINNIIALTISGITACIRFPGQLNSGLRKLHVNMIPFPNVHFLVPGLAPLPGDHRRYTKGTVTELVQQIFSPSNMLCVVDMQQGKLMTAAGIFRGKMSPRTLEQLMANLRNKNVNNFVDWIPNNIKTAICDIPPSGLEMSATFMGNTTAIWKLFQRIYDGSAVMFNKKAHLHWYTGEGMEEGEFKQAQELLLGIINEYKNLGTDNSETEKQKQHFCKYCKTLI